MAFKDFFGGADSKYGAEHLDILAPLTNIGSKMQNKKMYEESQKRLEEYMGKLLDLVPEYQKRNTEAERAINNLFGNKPTLDLRDLENALQSTGQNYSDITSRLKGLGDNLNLYDTELQGLGRKLSGIRSSTSEDFSKYLLEGDDYINSMLDETDSGADAYAQGYRRMANEQPEFVTLFNDQRSRNLGSSIQQLKSSGAASPTALATLLAGDQQAGADIALRAAETRRQMREKALDAGFTGSQAKAGAYANAVGAKQGQAGLRQSQGAFEAGITGQQAGLVSQRAELNADRANLLGQETGLVDRQTDLVSRRAALRESEYGASATNWMAELQWEMDQANRYNPLEFSADIYGNAAGIGWSDRNSALVSGAQTDQATQQNQMNTLAMLAKLFFTKGAG